MWVSSFHWPVATVVVLTATRAVPVPSVAVVRWRSLVVHLSTSLLLTRVGWSTMPTIWWWPPVTPSCQLAIALLLGELRLNVVLELGVEPFTHLLETCQRQIELSHHPLVVLSHLLKLHEYGPHVKFLLDDVTSYDKFLAHRLEASIASFLQTVAEAAAHFGHEVVLHKVHLQPLEASRDCGLVHIHVGVIVLQKHIICTKPLITQNEESNHIEDQRHEPRHTTYEI